MGAAALQRPRLHRWSGFVLEWPCGGNAHGTSSEATEVDRDATAGSYGERQFVLELVLMARLVARFNQFERNSGDPLPQGDNNGGDHGCEGGFGKEVCRSVERG